MLLYSFQATDKLNSSPKSTPKNKVKTPKNIKALKKLKTPMSERRKSVSFIMANNEAQGMLVFFKKIVIEPFQFLDFIQLSCLNHVMF